MLNWKRTCTDCHYFVREARGIQAQPVTLELSVSDRASARRSDFAWLKDHYVLCCARQVWDEGHNFDPATRYAVVAQTNRRGKCFFWPFRQGMMQNAAQQLQKEQADLAEKRRGRRLTLVSLGLATVALLVNAWIQVAKDRHWWPFH